MTFKTPIAKDIYEQKYANGMSWEEKAECLVEEVCQYYLNATDKERLKRYIREMKFIPGGRYLYYAGRPTNFYNNCFCLAGLEDTREEWSRLTHDAMGCLMSGGGIGIDYSVFREAGSYLGRTGGVASGPLPLMEIMNEVGRNVMQGGSRRSALYASLNWQHGDIKKFLYMKDWSPEVVDLKSKDFNFPAPMDMTNISVNWDDDFLEQINAGDTPETWGDSITQMLRTGEPGHSYNFGHNSDETLRNA